MPNPPWYSFASGQTKEYSLSANGGLDVKTVNRRILYHGLPEPGASASCGGEPQVAAQLDPGDESQPITQSDGSLLQVSPVCLGLQTPPPWA